MKTPANIYIDGENLVYQLVDVLVRKKVVSERAEMRQIDIISLFAKAVADDVRPINVRYYGTKLHEVEDLGEEAHEASLGMIKHREDWDKWLAKQKIEFVTAGNLKARKRGENVIFQEKGVDVRIAVDMVQAAYENDHLHFVIVSNDSDVIPAIRIVKKRGHKVTYIGMRGNLNKAIAAHVDNTITYTKDDIVASYERANQ